MTNSQLTSNEHEERLKQIRERQKWRANASRQNGRTPESNNTYTDIDFLLSLLDSQATGTGARSRATVAAPQGDAVLPADEVPKLMTTAEWESLSAESRFKINVYFSSTGASPDPDDAARDHAFREFWREQDKERPFDPAHPENYATFTKRYAPPAPPPVAPSPIPEQNLKKYAAQIIDAVVKSPCVVEVRFFSQSVEAEQIENEIAAMLAHIPTTAASTPSVRAAAEEIEAMVDEYIRRASVNDTSTISPPAPTTDRIIAIISRHCSPVTEGEGDEDKDAQRLAVAIKGAAVKAGMIKGDQPLTGPQLLMLCDDLANAALHTSVALDQSSLNLKEGETL